MCIAKGGPNLTPCPSSKSQRALGVNAFLCINIFFKIYDSNFLRDQLL